MAVTEQNQNTKKISSYRPELALLRKKQVSLIITKHAMKQNYEQAANHKVSRFT